jgi:hypothetical protein
MVSGRLALGKNYAQSTGALDGTYELLASHIVDASKYTSKSTSTTTNSLERVENSTIIENTLYKFPRSGLSF